jgi:hypothetical protein
MKKPLRFVKPTAAPLPISESALSTVQGGTETLRNVKNFDKPIRDYQA